MKRNQVNWSASERELNDRLPARWMEQLLLSLSSSLWIQQSDRNEFLRADGRGKKRTAQFVIQLAAVRSSEEVKWRRRDLRSLHGVLISFRHLLHSKTLSAPVWASVAREEANKHTEKLINNIKLISNLLPLSAPPFTFRALFFLLGQLEIVMIDYSSSSSSRPAP